MRPGRISIPRTRNPLAENAFNAFGKRGRPILFQVVDPTNQPLWPYLLALHVNPESFDESYAKVKTTVMTYGGWVEWIWPDDLDTISASGSTGGFIGPETGLIAGSETRGQQFTGRPGNPGRRATIAWERQEDLLELFHNNGAIYNGVGQPVLRGKVMCIFDRGIYTGQFTTFSPKETEDKPFSFELSWEFKVEETVYIFPGSISGTKPTVVPTNIRTNVVNESVEVARQELNSGVAKLTRAVVGETIGSGVSAINSAVKNLSGGGQ